MNTTLRPTTIIASLAILIAVCTAGSAPQATGPDPLVVMAEAAQKMLIDKGYNADISQVGNILNIRWNMRDYMVYTKDEKGHYGRELLKVVGPDHDGFWFSIRHREGKFEVAPGRPEARPDYYVLGALQRQPYFKTYPSVTNLDQHGSYILVDISVGDGTDGTVTRDLHRAMLTAIHDNNWTSPMRRRKP